MMGDRDYRNLIQNAIGSIGKELKIQIDPKDLNTIHLNEVVQCLRRSFYDRTDREQESRTGFSELISDLLRKLNYGSKPAEFIIDEIKLNGQADMIVDDAVILFRSSKEALETPRSSDVLFLNACMWIYNKIDGVIIYINGDRKETSFSLTKDKRMFEEVIRRVKVLHDLLKENKTPILEPSEDCSDCQYYHRCYMKKRMSKTVSLGEMLGLKKDED